MLPVVKVKWRYANLFSVDGSVPSTSCEVRHLKMRNAIEVSWCPIHQIPRCKPINHCLPVFNRVFWLYKRLKVTKTEFGRIWQSSSVLPQLSWSLKFLTYKWHRFQVRLNLSLMYTYYLDHVYLHFSENMLRLIIKGLVTNGVQLTLVR